MSKYDEFGFLHETVTVSELVSGDILIGHLGGISAVETVYVSEVIKGCSVIETEHGALYMDSEEPVVILERDKPASKLASIKANSDTSSTFDYDDYVSNFGIYW